MNKDDANQQSDLPKGLAKPAIRALTQAGVFRLEQVAQLSEKELKGLHGIGPNAVELLRGALATEGLTFAQSGNEG